MVSGVGVAAWEDGRGKDEGEEGDEGDARLRCMAMQVDAGC